MKNKILILILCIAFNKIIQAQNQNYIDSLSESIKFAKDDTLKVTALNLLGYELREANPEQSIKYGQQAIHLAKKLNFSDGLARAQVVVGTAMTNMGNFDDALIMLNEALSTFIKSGNKKTMGLAYNNIGIIFQYQGNYNEALKNYLFSLKIREEMDDKQGIASSTSNIGIIYLQTGNPPMALKYFLTGLKLKEEMGDIRGCTSNLMNIGVLYQMQTNITEAKKYFLKALKISQDNNDIQNIALAYKTIGECYHSEGNTSEALKNYHASLKINETLKNKYRIAYDKDNIANVYKVQRNYEAALLNYLDALRLREEIGDEQGVAHSFINLGDLKIGQKNYREARQYLEKGLNISKKIMFLEDIQNCYRSMVDLDSLEGKYKNAFENYKMFIAYRDSLINEDNSNKIVQAQMEYEFEKKEAYSKAVHEKREAMANAEIKRQTIIRNSTFGGVGIVGLFSFLLVRSSNRRKKVTFDKQVSEVEMKALRSQMNPHFIFNALQSVNDFVLKKDISNASNFLIKFAKLMRAVLENSVHKEVSLEKDLASLELYMQLESSRLDYPFDYEIIIDPKIDPEETMIPPLILQPFVENSIWHGLKHKKEKGKIKIEIKEVNNSIVCSIEDNGVGSEQAGLLKEPMTEKRESLGMKLTKERLKILEQIKNFKSRINVTDIKDGLNNPLGFRVELSLPLTTLS